jgi:ADP-heptose:LPS heptosyltransferase
LWHKFLMQLAKAYLRREARRRPPLPLSRLDPKEVGRVLLINNTALGDLLFSTPAFRALKQTYPHWRLEVLVHPAYRALVANNPHLDRTWTFPGRSRRLLTLARELHRQHYDLAIILHGNDPEATMLAWAAGPSFIIGSAASPLSFAYSASVPRTDPFEHAIERRLNFVRLLGADTADKSMGLFLPPEELRTAEAVLSRHFGPDLPLLAALHPTGSAPYKCWPAESFAALGNYLHRTYGARLLIVSGPRDREAATSLAARLAGPALVTGGAFSLLQTAALLSRCRLFMGNDSGPLHLALALKVPSVALMGADHPRRVGPYRVNWGAYLYRKPEVCQEEPCLNRRCPDNRCLKAIKVAEVIELLQKWWEPRFLKQ